MVTLRGKQCLIEGRWGPGLFTPEIINYYISTRDERPTKTRVQIIDLLKAGPDPGGGGGSEPNKSTSLKGGKNVCPKGQNKSTPLKGGKNLCPKRQNF
ncbi:hypothetical protein evm_010014 [Chilo suppressalis]|nr:hypothetical protein evm_010014 [Chilo suppressalis]